MSNISVTIPAAHAVLAHVAFTANGQPVHPTLSGRMTLGQANYSFGSFAAGPDPDSLYVINTPAPSTDATVTVHIMGTVNGVPKEDTFTAVMQAPPVVAATITGVDPPAPHPPAP